MTQTTSTSERALKLLGQGIAPEIVAATIGVSPSTISALLSDQLFAAKVAEIRFASLIKHNETDEKIDSIERRLIGKLENVIDFMVRPMEIVAALTKVNAMKRRGVQAEGFGTVQSKVTDLQLPTIIMNNFSQTNVTVNVNNQVIKAGEKELVTVQSSAMDKMVAARKSITQSIPYTAESSNENQQLART